MLQSSAHQAQTSNNQHHSQLLYCCAVWTLHAALCTGVDCAYCCREEVTVRQEVKEEVIPIAVKRQRQKKNVEYEDQVCAVQ